MGISPGNMKAFLEPAEAWRNTVIYLRTFPSFPIPSVFFLWRRLSVNVTILVLCVVQLHPMFSGTPGTLIRAVLKFGARRTEPRSFFESVVSHSML